MRLSPEFTEPDFGASLLHQHEAVPFPAGLVEGSAEDGGVEGELLAGGLWGADPTDVGVRTARKAREGVERSSTNRVETGVPVQLRSSCGETALSAVSAFATVVLETLRVAVEIA